MYLKINVQCSISDLLVFFALIVPCFSVKLKLYQTDQRMAVAAYNNTVNSLLECSVLFEKDKRFLSLSFKKNENICELSTNYPEDTRNGANGWNVYAPIVSGGWTAWTNWGTCTVTCGLGTRERTRSCTNPPASNGGTSCPGDSAKEMTCNEQHCNCGCYELTNVHNDAMSSKGYSVTDQTHCEIFHRYVFTGGNDALCPGCGTCGCCRPL